MFLTQMVNNLINLINTIGGTYGINVDGVGDFLENGIMILGGGVAAIGAFLVFNGITTAADGGDDVNPADKKRGYKTIASGLILVVMGITLVPLLSNIITIS